MSNVDHCLQLITDAVERGWLEYDYREPPDVKRAAYHVWRSTCSGLCIFVETRRTRATIHVTRLSPQRKQEWGSLSADIMGREIRLLEERLGKRGRVEEVFLNRLQIWDALITDIPAIVGILKEVLVNES